MPQFGWPDCPPAVRAQVEQLIQGVRAILASELEGAYLHGSLAMGCFNPERSDLDFLFVTREGMPVEVKRRLARRVLWFLREGAIGSKDEAGEWGLRSVPEPFRPVFSQALALYRGAPEDQRADAGLLPEFSSFAGREIGRAKRGVDPSVGERECLNDRNPGTTASGGAI